MIMFIYMVRQIIDIVRVTADTDQMTTDHWPQYTAVHSMTDPLSHGIVSSKSGKTNNAERLQSSDVRIVEKYKSLLHQNAIHYFQI